MDQKLADILSKYKWNNHPLEKAIQEVKNVVGVEGCDSSPPIQEYDELPDTPIRGVIAKVGDDYFMEHDGVWRQGIPSNVA